jgi:GxxExxY protein
VSEAIIGSAIEVHRALGPGLLESAYEACLAHELRLRGLDVERQKRLPVRYKGLEVEAAYRVDLVVADLVLVEVKAVSELIPIFDAQVLTYLQLTGLDVGLLLNFHSRVIRQGIRRLVRSGAAVGGSPERRRAAEHNP